MKLTLILLLLTICFAPVTLAQDAPDAKTKKLLEQAKSKGRELQAEITVSSSVQAQAVLIPRVDAERIFGKEIARNYAVIQLTVGNKSPTAAFVIHGVFIDYRDWALSGVPSSEMVAENRTNKYQAPSVPSQVASEEYRVIRGQLLDAQTDTTRNRLLRWLTFAGNLAGAFTFSLNEQGIVKGIAAATGVGIPGFATAWPDRTVEQLNRVSDLGFRTNKLVPKESSEVIVCFFPIDRFLTPGFRKIFLRSPALFFAPLLMLADPAVERDARAIVNDLLEEANAAQGIKLTFEQLKSGMKCYMKVRHPDPERLGYEVCLPEMGLETYKDPRTNQEKVRVMVVRNTNGDIVLGQDGKPQVINKLGFYQFLVLDFIGNVSLNRVTVTVDGVMSVDINTIAARIDEVVVDKVAGCGDDVGNECLWTSTTAGGGVRTGVIRGAYVTGAKLKLAEAETLGIANLTKIDEGSTDNEFRFSFKLNAPIDNQTKLHFTLTKDAAGGNGRPIESNTWEHVVAYFPSATKITSISVNDAANPTELTVTGKGFTTTPLVVTLIPKSGDSRTVTPIDGTLTDTAFKVALPTDANKLHPTCWQVQVKAGKLTSNPSDMFAVPAEPSLDSAERNDRFIYLKGKNLVDFGACGGLIRFKVMKTDNTEATDLKVHNWINEQPVLDLPDKAKTGDWKVQVLTGTRDRGSKPLIVRPVQP